MPEVNFELLRERRDELDLSNEMLSKRMELSYGYVANILSGRDKPSRRVILRFARVLGLPADDIEATDPEPDGEGEPSEETPAAPERTKDPSGPPRRRNGKDDIRGPRRAVAADQQRGSA